MDIEKTHAEQNGRVGREHETEREKGSAKVDENDRQARGDKIGCSGEGLIEF